MTDGRLAYDDRQPERLPPHNAEAEAAVLGSVLLDSGLVGTLAAFLAPEDFYLGRNEAIYAAMVALYERQAPIDYLLLLDELDRSGRLAEAGGATHLAGLLGAVPTPIHAAHYGRIVAHDAVMRRLISAGATIATVGFENSHPTTTAALEAAERALQGVAPRRTAGGPVALGTSLGDYLDDIRARHAEAEAGRPAPPGVPTGFLDLDRLLGGGLQRSDLVVLAARPSLGKTACALNVMANLALRRRGAALMFSLEMSLAQITGRLLATTSGVETARIRAGDYSDTEVRRIGEAIGQLAEARIAIDPGEGLSAPQIRERARRHHAADPLDLIVVDHLQLIAGSLRRREANRTEELAEITRQLKNMARELMLPVVLLSQLSRAVEQRTSKVPVLSDLRDSGATEQDADVVVFLYRDDHYHPDSERQGTVDLHVAKHRDGPTGQVTMLFDARVMRFRDVAASG